MRKQFRHFNEKVNKNQIKSKNEKPIYQEVFSSNSKINYITEVLEQRNIKFEIIENNDECITYKFKFEIDYKTYNFFLEKKREKHGIFLYINLIEKVPLVEFVDISIHIALLNSALCYGNLEFNDDASILRYRSSYIYDDSVSSFKKILSLQLSFAHEVLKTLIGEVFTIVFSENNNKQYIMPNNDFDVS